jgi:hypothetical protein
VSYAGFYGHAAVELNGPSGFKWCNAVIFFCGQFKPELVNVVLDRHLSFTPKSSEFKRQSKPDQQVGQAIQAR